MSLKKTKITLIAGGVGGAKMAEGFAALQNVDLTIIGNVADDDSFHGLWVSPDIDTVSYTLAGLINREQGWGVHDDETRALNVLNTLGQDTWMTLGDRDFGLHIYRTMRRQKGDRPSDIAKDIAQKFGVNAKIVLPTDDVVQTKVKTDAGWLSFQEYFVKEQCAPKVTALKYEGIETAKATLEAIAAIDHADLIVIAPSNPLVSITPILKIDGIEQRIIKAKAPVVAVSPLIAGKVIKGPADQMMLALGKRADACGIADYYGELIDCLYIDNQDAPFAPQIRAKGITCQCSNIFMADLEDKKRLAGEILEGFKQAMKVSSA